MTGAFKLKYLPYNIGYDEHPYWLIFKLEYILGLLRSTKILKNDSPKKGGKK